MQRLPGGALVCPDDRGPDITTLDRLNARAAKIRREPAAAPDLYVEAHPTPATILGATLHTWLKPASVSDFDVIDERIVRMYSREGGDFTAINLPGRRPRWHSDAFGAAPGIGGFNGWNTSSLSTSGFVALPAARHYVWMVMKITHPGSGTTVTLFTAASAGGTISRHSSGTIRATMSCADGVDTVIGPAEDTNAHLLEMCPLTTAQDRFVVDGVGYDGVRTGAYSASSTSATVSMTGVNGFFGELVIATEPPSAAQATQMRSYFASEFTELDIS
jgi:hypothetical protein